MIRFDLDRSNMNEVSKELAHKKSVLQDVMEERQSVLINSEHHIGFRTVVKYDNELKKIRMDIQQLEDILQDSTT